MLHNVNLALHGRAAPVSIVVWRQDSLARTPPTFFFSLSPLVRAAGMKKASYGKPRVLDLLTSTSSGKSFAACNPAMQLFYTTAELSKAPASQSDAWFVPLEVAMFLFNRFANHHWSAEPNPANSPIVSILCAFAQATLEAKTLPLHEAFIIPQSPPRVVGVAHQRQVAASAPVCLAVRQLVVHPVNQLTHVSSSLKSGHSQQSGICHKWIWRDLID